MVNCNTLISACEKAQKPTRALQVFQVLKGERLVPDGVTNNALISACERCK